jgi:hypothetical protein
VRGGRSLRARFVGWVEARANEVTAIKAETQRHEFESIIARFFCVMLGFGRVQNGLYPTYKWLASF